MSAIQGCPLSGVRLYLSLSHPEGSGVQTMSVKRGSTVFLAWSEGSGEGRGGGERGRGREKDDKHDV